MTYTLAPALDTPDLLTAVADLPTMLGAADTLQLYPAWLLDEAHAATLPINVLVDCTTAIEAGVIKANAQGTDCAASADWYLNGAKEPDRIATAIYSSGGKGFIIAMDEPLRGAGAIATLADIAGCIDRYGARVTQLGGVWGIIEAFPLQSVERITSVIDLLKVRPTFLRLDVDHVGVKLTAAHWASMLALQAWCASAGIAFELIITDPNTLEPSAIHFNQVALAFARDAYQHGLRPSRIVVQSWNPHNLPMLLPANDPSTLTWLVREVVTIFGQPDSPIGDTPMPSTRSTAVLVNPAGNGQCAQRPDGLYLSVDSAGTMSWKSPVGADETFTINDAKTAFIFHNTFAGVQDFVRPVTKVGDVYYVLEDGQ